MFSYIIPIIALLLVLSNPILQLFQPDRPLVTERPAINESLLAIPGGGRRGRVRRGVSGACVVC